MTFNTRDQPFLRALIGCQEDDYDTVRYQFVHTSPKPVVRANGTAFRAIPRIMRRPRLSDEQVAEYLSQYNDVGFKALPEWLQDELKCRRIAFEVREPTELEKWETITDAYEHRVLYNEMTIQDFMDHYTGKRNYHHV